MDTTSKRCMESTPDDGIKFGEYECEDDDSLPDDGCFNGIIEDGWQCDGGTLTSPDVCTKIPPVLVS